MSKIKSRVIFFAVRNIHDYIYGKMLVKNTEGISWKTRHRAVRENPFLFKSNYFAFEIKESNVFVFYVLIQSCFCNFWKIGSPCCMLLWKLDLGGKIIFVLFFFHNNLFTFTIIIDCIYKKCKRKKFYDMFIHKRRNAFFFSILKVYFR